MLLQSGGFTTQCRAGSGTIWNYYQIVPPVMTLGRAGSGFRSIIVSKIFLASWMSSSTVKCCAGSGTNL